MQLFSWLHKRMTGRPQTRSTPARLSATRFRPHFETLEARDLPSFSAPVVYSAPQTAALVTGDINGDGKLDLISIQPGQGIAVQLNNGNGTFGAAITSSDHEAQLGPATALAVGPYKGKPSIWVAHEYTGDGMDAANFSILQLTQPTQPNGSEKLTDVSDWIPPTTARIGGHISSLALADLNGDGQTDLVATNGRWVYVARSTITGIIGIPGSVQSYLIPEPTLSPSQVQIAVGNLNGDGKLDIVVTTPTLNAVSVLLNNGNGTFGTAQTYAVGASPTAMAVGDVSGDGKLDVVTANASGTVSILPGLGNGTFAIAETDAVANSVDLGDFNGDGRLDIATTGGEMDVLFSNGSGFAAYQKVGPAGSGVAAADFNGDFYPDLAQIDAATGNLEVLLNNANWGQPSFAVAGFPASTTAGFAQTFTVTALNPDGSVNAGYSGTVHFSSSDPQAVLPTNATLVNGVGTFQATLKTAGAESITATDTATGRITGNEAGITVNAGAAAALVFSTYQTGATAGGPLELTLAAKDAYGNHVAGYAGSVHFTSSDPRAVLPANYTFGSGDAGQHFFDLSLETAGTQSVTAADVSNSSLTATEGGIVVSPAVAAKFVLIAPASVKSGAKFTLTITVEDAYGNVTGYSGTLHFSSSDGTATLPRDDTITQATNPGVFTLTNAFVLKKKGVQTITVTDTVNPSLTGTVSITVS